MQATSSYQKLRQFIINILRHNWVIDVHTLKISNDFFTKISQDLKLDIRAVDDSML